jgi:glycosyltransferase involved in cell wall biosynthesis
MKIAVWHNLPSGGGKRALHDHVRGLVMRGHHVESWSPPRADLSYLSLSSYGPEHVVPLESGFAEPRGWVGRELKPYRDVVAKIEAMKRHARQCAAEIGSKGFDLILGNSCSVFAAPFIARYVEVPTVLYLQEPHRRFYEASRFWDMTRLEWVAPMSPYFKLAKNPLRWNGQAAYLVRYLADVQAIRIQAREEAANVHAFDRVLCNSRFSRESILRVYGREAMVCYLGIDTDAFRPTGAPKERYAIGLGTFGPHKGIDIAIRALATMEPAVRPDLVWIGNFATGDYLQYTTELATNLGVNLLPKMLVEHDELVDLLSRAAVMIFTSRLEPFGYAPLEANACGTPVVGIAEGGIRESIEHGCNGLLVEGDDPIALGEAISHYVNDLKLARDDGIRACNHIISQWRLEAAIDRLERHLFEAIQTREQAVARRDV